MGEGQMVVMGRLELDPPLEEGEQDDARGIGYDVKNKIYALIDDHYHRIEGRPTVSDFEQAIEAKIGETFYVRMPARDRYVLGALIVLSVHPREDAYLPGGLRIPVRKGDRAIYVGTIRYERNEFMEIESAVIVDDFERARKRFRKHLGTDLELVKRLPRTLKETEAVPPEDIVPLRYITAE